MNDLPILPPVSAPALSAAQRRFYFLHRLAAPEPAYNICFGYDIDGALDEAPLAAAIAALIQRHDALRLSVEETAEGLHAETQPFSGMLLRRLTIADWRGAADIATRDFCREPFDLARPPLIRALLLSQSPTKHRLVFSVHHIAFDDFSMRLFAGELRLLYGAEPGNSDALPPLRASELAPGQSTAAAAHSLQYWRRVIDSDATAELPTDYPRPKRPTFRGEMASLRFDGEAMKSIKHLAQAHCVTTVTIFLGAYLALLARLAGRQKFVITTPYSERYGSDRERLIGNFLNTVLIPGRVDPDMRVGAYLRTLFRTMGESFRHGGVAFDQVVGTLAHDGAAASSALSQAMFVQNLSLERWTARDATFEPFRLSNGTAKVDLNLSFTDGGDHGLLSLEYASDLFDADHIRWMLRRYRTLIEAMTIGGDELIGELPDMDASERDLVTTVWNHTSRAYGGPSVLTELCRRTATERPASTAIVDAGRTVPYREFISDVARVTRALTRRGIGPGARVAFCLQRSLDLAVTYWAVLFSGAAAAPLDPDHPELRLAALLEQIRPQLLITHDETEQIPALRATAPRASINILRAEGTAVSGLAEGPQPVDDAYLLFTSGSTGRPKGVLVQHAAIRNRILWMQDAIGLSPDDIVLQKTPVSFDVSVWEFLWPLTAGATLAIAAPGSHRDSRRLVEQIRELNVSVLHFVPSMLRSFLAEPLAESCRSLRQIICSGEALTSDIVTRVRKLLPQAKLWNLYGPTEAAIDVTAWLCGDDDERRLPRIGRPIANTEILILDQRERTQPIGVPGELYIGGVNLARNYLDAPARTAQAFVPHPFKKGQRLYRTGDLARWQADGAIEFLGRYDGQLKVNGVRIEASEIETACRSYPGIEQAAVTPRPTADGRTQLIAFVVPACRQTPDERALRSHLSARLPAAVLPAEFVWLDRLPMTSSGKVDRAALRPPDRGPVARSDPDQTLTPEMEHVAHAWSTVLRRRPPHIDCDFFSAGGDSILLLQLLICMRQRGLELSLEQALSGPTVRTMAQNSIKIDGATPMSCRNPAPFALVDSHTRESQPGDIVDAFPASRLVAGLIYANRTHATARCYITSYDLQARFDPRALREAAAGSIARHPLLRAAVDDTREPALILVRKSAALEPEIFDLTGASVQEQTRAIDASMAALSETRFDWSRPPLLRIVIHIRSASRFELTLVEPWLDGWSVAVLGTEILRSYATAIAGFDKPPHTEASPVAQPSYALFVRREQEAFADPQLRRFWRRWLEDCPDSRVFGHDVPATRFGRLAVDISSANAGLRTAAERFGVPLKALLLAIHVRVVACLSGQARAATAVMISGREEIAGGDSTIGLFLNALPILADIATPDWASLVRSVHSAEQALWQSRRFPLSSTGWRRPYDTLFNFTNFHPYRTLPRDDDFALLRVRGTDQTYFALAAHFAVDPVDDAITLTLESNGTDATVQELGKIADRYRRAIVACTETPDAAPRDSNLLSDSEQAELLAGDHATQRDYGPPRRLEAMFSDVASQYPDRTAIVTSHGALTFEEVERLSATLARQLRELGVRPRDRVGLVMRRSADAVIGILGILKAEAAYAPIDPSVSPERLKGLLAQIQPAALITHANAQIPDATCPVTAVPQIATAATATRADVSSSDVDAAAHLLFTSGSTGLPKAVVTSHRAIYNRLFWMWGEYPFQPGERMACKTSISFVDSVWEIFGGLLRAVPTVVLDDAVALDPRRLADAIDGYGVTRLSLVPTLLGELVAYLDDADRVLARLRVLISSGEPLGWELARRVHGRLPRAQVLNLYGATETTGDVTAFEVHATQSGGGLVPIGRPIANSHVVILGGDNHPAPRGARGELLAAGACLCDGYWQNSAANRERFIDILVNGRLRRFYRTGDIARWNREGNLEYLGRSDRQLKLRGIRIEPAEIEAVAIRVPGIRACVVDIDEIHGQLVAVLETDRSADEVAPKVRQILQSSLPASFVPNRIAVARQIPRTATGKIDRRALGTLPVQEVKLAEADDQGAALQQLMALWRDVLGVADINADTNFFDAGGQSLTALRLVSRLRSEFHVEIPLQAVFDRPTIRALAPLIDAADREPHHAAEATAPYQN